MPKKPPDSPILDARYWKLMKRVAANIKRVRSERRLTQEDMLSLGFERRWFQRIESGTYSVSLPTLDRLARAFKVDVSEFFHP
ncbi:MAG: XRE family transcriptional regulator [Proteobacteria bacterium]|nr:MAG: XRE family transcriptional regulator [Pseudomonadota bacterium]